jgi:transcriptional regulator with XRE-family HTH domain
MTTHTDSDKTAAAVGAEIRRLRLANGWGLRSLAGGSGVEFGRLGKIERGESAGVETYRRIAAALGVSMSALFAVVEARPRRSLKSRKHSH